MDLKVKIKFNSLNKIIKDHGLDKDGRVTEYLRDTVYRLYKPYVPRENGNLHRQVTFPNKHSIKHTSHIPIIIIRERRL